MLAETRTCRSSDNGLAAPGSGGRPDRGGLPQHRWHTVSQAAEAGARGATPSRTYALHCRARSTDTAVGPSSQAALACRPKAELREVDGTHFEFLKRSAAESLGGEVIDTTSVQ